MTTPKSLPASPPKHNSPPKQLSRPKQLSPPKPTGPALRALCTGDHQSPRTPNKLDRGPLPPRRRCSLHADRVTSAHPKRQSPPKRGGQSQRTRCAHSHKLVPSIPVFTPFLPRFYPAFTPFCSVFTPLLLRFYPTFTPVLPCSASSFYPTFTPFLPSFYPVPLRRFYPRFTPFLPHLRRVKCQTYPVFTPLLPHRQFLPSQAFYPGFTPFLVLCACRFPRFYPRGKTAHFLLVSIASFASVPRPEVYILHVANEARANTQH